MKWSPQSFQLSLSLTDLILCFYQDRNHSYKSLQERERNKSDKVVMKTLKFYAFEN